MPCLLPGHLRGLMHLLEILWQHAMLLQTDAWFRLPWADLVQSIGS